MLIKKIITAIFCAFSINSFAQYDPFFSHYWEMKSQFNPAAAGNEDKLNVNAAYALQLAGFERNPNTIYAAADMPFMLGKTKHGVGAYFMSDNLGAFSHQRISVQYNYKFKLFGGVLSAGIQGGLLTEKLDGSKIDLEDTSDPAFSSGETKGNTIDLGVGLMYSHKNWYVGASVQHANSPLVELGETNQLQIDRTYYLMCGYNIKLKNPFLSINTAAIGRTDLVAYRAYVSARLVYSHEKKIMYGGVGYSPTNSVTMMVGGVFHGVKIGYSYEMYTKAISPINGSHELCIGYQTDLHFVKKGKNKHKSVRLL